MCRAVEEVEFRDGEGLDDHDDRCSDNCEEGDDVHRSNDIKNDEAWTGQLFAGEGHFSHTSLPERLDFRAVRAFRHYAVSHCADEERRQ